MSTATIEIRSDLQRTHSDVYTPEAVAALAALAPFDADRKALMAARIARRAEHARLGHRIDFLDPEAVIERTSITVRDARAGAFVGGEIPHDLRRQWIQGTGPAAKPHAAVETSIRNVAFGSRTDQRIPPRSLGLAWREQSCRSRTHPPTRIAARTPWALGAGQFS